MALIITVLSPEILRDEAVGNPDPPTAIITSPAPDQAVNGIVTIVGTADGPDFTQYLLEYVKGKLPLFVNYQAIGSNPRTTPVVDGALGVWDTSSFSDGDYTIRLTARNSFAEETVVTVRIVVDNAPPVAFSATAVDETTIDVLFSEQIGDVLDQAYFSITGLAISAAARLYDWHTIRLTTDTQSPGAPYTVTVRSASPTVADLCETEIGAVNNTADFTGYSPAVRGDGALLRRHADDGGCGGMAMGCHNVAMHSSDSTTTAYGVWGQTFTCATCHEPHESINIYLVKDVINTPNSGDMAVDFRTIGIYDLYNDPNPVPGVHDYSMGDATDGASDSICEVCHTQTSHFRNDDAATPSPNHHNDTNCTACHPHELGFAPVSHYNVGSNCMNCHCFHGCDEPGGRNAPRAPDIPHYDGMGECVDCHVPQSADFAAPSL